MLLKYQQPSTLKEQFTQQTTVWWSTEQLWSFTGKQSRSWRLDLMEVNFGWLSKITICKTNLKLCVSCWMKFESWWAQSGLTGQHIRWWCCFLWRSLLLKPSAADVTRDPVSGGLATPCSRWAEGVREHPSTRARPLWVLTVFRRFGISRLWRLLHDITPVETQ